jgi:post-segregation antitoxin (ccd killing protein)
MAHFEKTRIGFGISPHGPRLTPRARTSRLNISIPDDLYEKLDRFRGEVNASRVCAQALEKELRMVEERVASAGDDSASRVERLVQRLTAPRKLWFQRGWQDGEEWAAELATADELCLIGEEWDDDGAYDLDQDDLPETFDLWKTLSKWPGHEAVEEDTSLKEEYLHGWHYAVRDLWKVAKPRLQAR